MVKNLYVLLVVFTLFSCADSEVVKVETEVEESSVFKLDDLKWLEGVWVDKSTFGFRGVTYIEDWVYYEDSLSGRGLSVENGDTTQTEQFAIRIINEQLMYVARPATEPVIGFPSIKEDKNELVFENKAHDFPSRISYQRVKKDSLIIELNGIVLPQGDRTMKFKLKRFFPE